jgi:hypothetical protein
LSSLSSSASTIHLLAHVRCALHAQIPTSGACQCMVCFLVNVARFPPLRAVPTKIQHCLKIFPSCPPQAFLVNTPLHTCLPELLSQLCFSRMNLSSLSLELEALRSKPP